MSDTYKKNLCVQGQELTVYFEQYLSEDVSGKCHFCGKDAYGVIPEITVTSIVTEKGIEVKKKNPLWNHTQSILRKKMCHGLKVCSEDACIAKIEKVA